jgi:hypothetical protein
MGRLEGQPWVGGVVAAGAAAEVMDEHLTGHSYTTCLRWRDSKMYVEHLMDGCARRGGYRCYIARRSAGGYS